MTRLSFYNSSNIALLHLNVISPTLMHKTCFRFLLGPVDFNTKQMQITEHTGYYPGAAEIQH
jgi:hypothetical protein